MSRSGFQTSIILPQNVPQHWDTKLLVLPDNARSMSMLLQASRGGGKSRFIGRIIAWLDAIRGIPVILIDPTGGSIDNFLDKLIRLPQPQRDALAQRIKYIDMSGRSGFTVGFPLYYRLGNESLYTISQRYIDCLRTIDPALTNAPIQGFNSVYKVATVIGEILTAAGCQITEAPDLLSEPEVWLQRFEKSFTSFPEVQPAIELFRSQYVDLPEKERASRIDMFSTKTMLFALDPSMRAMFGASQPGLDWSKVVADRAIVLLDFRHEIDIERKRFKMLWVFNTVVDYLKYRGPGHRHTPISLIVDELTALLNFSSMGGGDVFATQLDELINIISRNYNLWLTVAYQELFQIPPRLQKTLLNCGTLLFGSSSDVEAALAIAKNLFEYDPLLVKRFEAVYRTVNGVTDEIDNHPVEYSINEQDLLHAYRLQKQERFHFLGRLARGEGNVHNSLQRISIEQFDKGLWVQEERVEKARAILSKKSGVPIEQMLAEIDERGEGSTVSPKQVQKTATINVYDPTTHHPLISQTTTPPFTTTENSEREDDDDLLYGDRKET